MDVLRLGWLLACGLCLLTYTQAMTIQASIEEVEDVIVSDADNTIEDNNEVASSADCVWVMQCGKALYGLNDKTLRNVDLEECQQACLAETDFTCLSIDYLSRGSCYLSRDNAQTQPSEIGDYPGCDHYDLVCDEDELLQVAFEEVEGTGCGFTKACQMALYSYNTKVLRDQSVDECKRACIDEDEFDCLSFDYNPNSERCYLSEENSQTRPNDMGAHGETDYYEKKCFAEPEPDNGGGSGDSDESD